MAARANINQWLSLLVNSEAEQAREAIASISRAIVGRLDGFWKWGWEMEFPHSLGFGSAGIALFLSYLAKASGDRGYLDAAARLLEEALRGAESLSESPGFLSGDSGVLWTFEHLNRHLYPESFPVNLSAASQQAINHGVSVASQHEVATGMMDGLSGICLYLAERMPEQAAGKLFESITDRLADLAVEEPPGVVWEISRRAELELRTIVPGFRSKNRVYITGAGYGVAGIVGAMIAGCGQGMANLRTRRVIERAVSWLLAQRQAGAIAFPQAVGVSVPPRPNGWLVGDPGIAMVLFNAGRALGRDDWQAIALDIAHADARNCLGQVTSKGAPFSLLEGAAGRAHVFNRLFQATGDPLFADVARQHYRAVLDSRCRGQGIGGFRFQEIDFKGLLTGAAGVGLALLAAVSTDEPDWDRAILASVRHVADQHPALVPVPHSKTDNVGENS